MFSYDSKIKIKEIEVIENIYWALDEKKSPLSIWYEKVRDKSIYELSNGDITRFIRQNLFLKYVMPEAILRIKKCPIEGEMFDGEILYKINEIDDSFWAEECDLKNEIINVLKEWNIDYLRKNIEWQFEKDLYKFFGVIYDLLNRLKVIL